MIYKKRLNTAEGVPGLLRVAGLLLLFLFVVMYLAWPGNHMWGDPDQAINVHLALQANQTGTLSTFWRMGNAGIDYHPFPIWIYQLSLMLTHDLILIRFVKALISLLACLAGLHYLSRALAYPGWIVILFGFSPFCYLYGFELTADTWLIPVSLMTFAGYARFYEKQTLGALSNLLLLTVLSVYLHPRGCILFFAVMMALVIFDGQWLRKKVIGLILVLSAAALILVPYLMHHGIPTVSGDFLSSSVSLIDRTALFVSTVVSGSLFFSYDLFQLFVPFAYISQPLAGIVKALIGITMIGYLLVMIGICLTIAGLIKAYGREDPLSLEDRLGGLALLTVCVFSAVITILNLFNTVEYYSIVWFCFFFFIWRAIKSLWRWKCLKLLSGTYIISMAVSWMCLWLITHFAGIGLTLADAVAASQQISRYSPQSRVVQTVNHKYGNLVDIMNSNFEGSFGNTGYYKKYVGFMNQSELLQNCLKGKYIYTTLGPLLDINYADRDTRDLPVRTIVLNFQDVGDKGRLTVKAYPAGVKLE